MADKTKIEWADATWNPVTGCSKVSQGCKHCYAERQWPRMTRLVPSYAGRDFTDVACHADRLDQPLRWKKPRRVFVNSMSDLFHEVVPDDFILSVFVTMAAARQHTFQILTKRPARMLDLMTRWKAAGLLLREGCGVELRNVWLGVSVEDQATADERIPLLLQTPAAVRWISAEPLLGPVDLTATPAGDILCRCGGCMEMTPDTRIDWVVAGGESGKNARPMHPAWARSLRDQCAAAGVPFLFKQWGEWLRSDLVDSETQSTVWRDRTHFEMRDAGMLHEFSPALPPGPPHFSCNHFLRVGKRAAGRLLDGVQHDAYPEARP
ncbi:MAG: phage Gp37/Gp68 family protein [Rhodocyclales bacterium]|nr:phage Gp37/Gp68 family protein [Rhodocyclales bacterium]